jgi:hypothetical protein
MAQNTNKTQVRTDAFLTTQHHHQHQNSLDAADTYQEVGHEVLSSGSASWDTVLHSSLKVKWLTFSVLHSTMSAQQNSSTH